MERTRLFEQGTGSKRKRNRIEEKIEGRCDLKKTLRGDTVYIPRYYEFPENRVSGQGKVAGKEGRKEPAGTTHLETSRS